LTLVLPVFHTTDDLGVTDAALGNFLAVACLCMLSGAYALLAVVANAPISIRVVACVANLSTLICLCLLMVYAVLPVWD
jgi:hypothetical protein